MFYVRSLRGAVLNNFILTPLSQTLPFLLQCGRMEAVNNDMQAIISLAKRRGFIFPSSEIYGGVEALWDFGPLGVLMKQRIKQVWFRRFVQERADIVPLEGSILMSPKVWEASGHVENFTDPLIECKACHARYRADHMEEGKFMSKKAKRAGQCPACGGMEFTEPKNFQLMFKTFLGPVQDEQNVTYLRPETAQSMFVDFKTVQEVSRMAPPFGIAQIGKAFRNEITTGNFVFRSREFEQMEIEYFVKPGEDEAVFEEWKEAWMQFCLDLGLRAENLRFVEHEKGKLAHYSKRTVDIEYQFPFGWGELAGVANRTDFDLKQHARAAGERLGVRDRESGETYVPYAIEPTIGVERLLLALLADSYETVKGGRSTTTTSNKEEEVVLRLSPTVAPIQVAVLPLVKNKPEIVEKAQEVAALLRRGFMVQYDEAGAVGRRYRRQDEIGTPFCVTVDYESLQQDGVTVRERDSMAQERVPVDELTTYLSEKFDG